MLDISPATAGSAAFGAAVVATLAALAGKFLVPRWVESREKFEEAITKQLQGMLTERAHLLREQAAENRRLQERMDKADNEIKYDIVVRETALREMAHRDVNRMNVEIGKVAGGTEENARNIAGINERLEAMEQKAEERHEQQGKAIHALDKGVDRLASAVEALAKNVRGNP